MPAEPLPADATGPEDSPNENLGIALRGIAVDGIAVRGIAVDGIAVRGIAVDAIAVRGIAVDGMAAWGISVCGIVDLGIPAPGMASEPEEVGVTGDVIVGKFPKPPKGVTPP